MAEGAPTPLNINTSPYIEISEIPLRFYFQHGVVLLINPSDPNSSLALNLNTYQVSLLNGHPIETEPIKITGEGLHDILLFRSVGILVIPVIKQIIHLSRKAIQVQEHALPLGFDSNLPFEINGVMLTIDNPYYITINLETGESMPLVPVAEALGAAGGAAGGAGGSPVPEIPRGMVTEEDDKRFIQLVTYANEVIIPQSNYVIRVLNDLRNSQFILDNSTLLKRKYEKILGIHKILKENRFYNVNAKIKNGLESIIDDFITKLKDFQKSLNKIRFPDTLGNVYFMYLEQLKRNIIGIIPNIQDELKDTGQLRENITRKLRELKEKNRREEVKKEEALIDGIILGRGRSANPVEYNKAEARTIQRQRNMEAAEAAALAKAEANAAAQSRGSQNNSMGLGPEPMNFSYSSLPPQANNVGAAGGAPAAAPAAAAGAAALLPELLPIQVPLGVPPKVLAAAAASAAAGGNAGGNAGAAAGGNGGAAAGGNGGAAAGGRGAARVYGYVGPENLGPENVGGENNGGENNGGRSPPFAAAANGNARAAAGNAGAAARPATPPGGPPANGIAPPFVLGPIAAGNAGGAPVAAARAGNAGGAPVAAARAGNAGGAPAAAARAGNAGGAAALPYVPGNARGATQNQVNNVGLPEVPLYSKGKNKDDKLRILNTLIEYYNEQEGIQPLIEENVISAARGMTKNNTIPQIEKASGELYTALVDARTEFLDNGEGNNQGGGRRKRKTLKRKVKSHKSSKKTRGRK
jgi:hypothetical protein